ncbi:hypothetical protein T492DRAFT_873946 [Pavlovales sp. CCMP2436]|nr:hypothetical protein T492DRAFT_873946 [Pavlovales sp. CCMP2436]
METVFKTEGGRGRAESGARISTTLRPGLYSLVLSGARASPEQVCRPFQLVAAASPAPLRKWTTAEAGVMLVAVAALTVAGRSFALSSQMQRPTSVLSLGTLGAPPPRPSDALEGGTPLRTPRHSDDGLPPRPLRASDGSSPPHPPRTSDGGAVLL